MNRYPLWKYLLVLAVMLISGLYALPNLFGEDPAVQVSRSDAPAEPELVGRVRDILDGADIGYRSVTFENGRLLVRLDNEEAQLRARDLLDERLSDDYVAALNLAPRTPAWLRAIGAQPMALGLDLRGGVHFLMEVDMEAAVDQALERYQSDLRRLLRENRLRYSGIEQREDSLLIRFREPDQASQAIRVIEAELPELSVGFVEGGESRIRVGLTEAEMAAIKDRALQQNITTIRNRVNELGVAEPVVQRQGSSRIVVQLPGVQDTARAKEIIGTTATLEFHLVDSDADPYAARQSGRTPIGSRLYETRDGEPVVLEREVIVSGDQLVDAAAGFDQQSGSPAVFVTLDGAGARRMGEVTRENIGRPMAVVFIETHLDTVKRGDEVERIRRVEETVINIATIRDAFSRRFQITGVGMQEARNLALLLRAGALAAPVDIIEERTIGPSLGQENIEQGFAAVVVGMLLVMAFMAVYYRGFGLIADAALMTNLVIIIAVLSALQATLTLPGIAGIVLTVGMAVDANVLIFERIREELRVGNSPQASIHAGYAKAFSTIADANITTLIAAVVLFGLGTGPVRGFAVTLSIGIVTSMFTAIMGTRAAVNLVYGARRLQRLSI